MPSFCGKDKIPERVKSRILLNKNKLNNSYKYKRKSIVFFTGDRIYDNDCYHLQIIKDDLSSLKEDINLLFGVLDTSYDQHIDKFYHFPSTIHLVTVSDKRSKKGYNCFVPLSGEAMRSVVGCHHYTKIRDFLITYGFIETTGSFIKGKKCMGFRLGQKYRDLLINKDIKFSKAKTHLNTKSDRFKYKEKDIDANDTAKIYLEKQLKTVTFDENEAQQLIDVERLTNPDSFTNHGEMCLDFHLNAIRFCNHYNKRSSKCGRVYNTITNLAKYLRPSIRLNKRKPICGDIKACQPLLLCLLYDKITDYYEYCDFKNLVQSGGFYENVINYIKNTFNIEYSKDKVKDILWKYVFGRIIVMSCDDYKEINSYFSTNFPKLREKIINFKKRLSKDEIKPHAKLPIFLQKMESDAIIDHLVVFAAENNIPILTIHDSFLCLPEHAKIFENKTIEIFKELFDLIPKLEIDDLDFDKTLQKNKEKNLKLFELDKTPLRLYS